MSNNLQQLLQIKTAHMACITGQMICLGNLYAEGLLTRNYVLVKLKELRDQFVIEVGNDGYEELDAIDDFLHSLNIYF